MGQFYSESCVLHVWRDVCACGSQSWPARYSVVIAFQNEISIHTENWESWDFEIELNPKGIFSIWTKGLAVGWSGLSFLIARCYPTLSPVHLLNPAIKSSWLGFHWLPPPGGQPTARDGG